MLVTAASDMANATFQELYIFGQQLWKIKREEGTTVLSKARLMGMHKSMLVNVN